MSVKQGAKVKEEVEWLCTNNLHPGPVMQLHKFISLATQGISTMTSSVRGMRFSLHEVLNAQLTPETKLQYHQLKYQQP